MSKSFRIALVGAWALALLWTVPRPAGAGEQAATPWWETFERAATGTEVVGVPVSTIDEHWRSAKALSRADLDAEQRADLERKGGWSFRVTGDFNNDGRPDKAVVGTYVDHRGKPGRFAAVFTLMPSSRWVRVYRETIEGKAGFSALRMNTDDKYYPVIQRIYWSTCLDCKTIDTIAWTESGYALITYE